MAHLENLAEPQLLNLFLIWSLCPSVLQVKLHMKLNLCFEKPYMFSFDSRRPWFIVSKAFQRFIYIAEIFFLYLRLFCHFSSMTATEWCLPCETHFEILFFHEFINLLAYYSLKDFWYMRIYNSPSIKGQVFYILA